MNGIVFLDVMVVGLCVWWWTVSSFLEKKITYYLLDGPDECGETGNLIFDFQARDFHFLKSLEEMSLIHISPHNVN